MHSSTPTLKSPSVYPSIPIHATPRHGVSKLYHSIAVAALSVTGIKAINNERGILPIGDGGCHLP